MIIPVLLSGGFGSRLWPSSRKSFPKQFINFVDDKYSLLQMTAQRINSFSIEKSGWIIVGNEEHRFLILDQMNEINTNIESIILEPIAKNTAPAITLAAIEALKISPDAKLLVQPADHLITDYKYFEKLINDAVNSKEKFLTFGVVPSFPETGYGYIKVGKKLNNKAFKAQKFIEKPNLKKANYYLNKGGYLWNSGIFFLDAKEYLNEIGLLSPDILSSCRRALKESVKDSLFIKVNKKQFESCPSISIDYAVMEKSDKISVMPFDHKWSDLGAWNTISDAMIPDANKNIKIGNAMTFDTENTLIRSESRLVTTLGVKDLVIAETTDAVLVASKEAAQNVNKIVENMKIMGKDEINQHALVHRPWGSYITISCGDFFQVKKIIVKTNKSLSLQSHKFRSEHWVVVRGVAEVINGEETLILNKNQSTYINVGTKHRLSNIGKNDLIIIEVQTGSYLGEDDIIRYEDDFGRS